MSVRSNLGNGRFLWIGFLTLIVVAGHALASPSEHLNFGKQLNASQCNAGGKLVINVNQRVLHSADTGVDGNDWALDDYNRQIQVWQLSANTFCAVLKYQGSWDTAAGPSPGGTTTLTAGIIGTFEGGYQTTVFTATLKTTPLASTRGNIGTFDYMCTATNPDNFPANCPGFVDWTSLYFDNVGGDFGLAWWGWVYHGGKNGSWIDEIINGGFNSGDIHP